MPNAGGSGYYRWTLDEASWAALIENFASVITPVEALSAIDSAFAAFEAGKLDAANLLKYRGRLITRAGTPGHYRAITVLCRSTWANTLRVTEKSEVPGIRTRSLSTDHRKQREQRRWRMRNCCIPI